MSYDRQSTWWTGRKIRPSSSESLHDEVDDHHYKQAGRNRGRLYVNIQYFGHSEGRFVALSYPGTSVAAGIECSYTGPDEIGCRYEALELLMGSTSLAVGGEESYGSRTCDRYVHTATSPHF